MRRSDHVFAYTESGVEVAISAGVHSGDVTAVMNSTDVAELLSAYEAFSEVELTRMLDEYVLTPGKTFGFIGGLDGPKRISFLAEVLDRMWYIDQQVKVLIGGTGAEDKLLTGAVNRGQVVMFGYAGPQEKAAIMRLSQAILSPGRIGLLAIDCLAVGIPILATEWKYHAPEFEYLEQGKDVIISANDVTSYIELLLKSTTTECKLETRSGRPYPSVEQMVQRFAGGVKSMMLD
ncbi:glycosyltransferase [Mycolicibacterium iranicum]|uniref:glycosyltransferase n=1 Tax=Mycolicibacterium iranicum TaxID=912594 RepID=UPI0013A558E5|nr:glycosyltransferase [Mycolicibacterium iranicum]